MEIWIYKIGTGWRYWNGLTAGYWQFPDAEASNLSDINIYHTGLDGVVEFDNLEIAIIP